MSFTISTAIKRYRMLNVNGSQSAGVLGSKLISKMPAHESSTNRGTEDQQKINNLLSLLGSARFQIPFSGEEGALDILKNWLLEMPANRCILSITLKNLTAGDVVHDYSMHGFS